MPDNPALFGRLGGVRSKSNCHDVTFFVAYGYVEPRTDKERSMALLFWEQLSEWLAQLPSRSVPVVLIDANGRVGIDSEAHASLSAEANEHIGYQRIDLKSTSVLGNNFKISAS